MSFLAQLLTIDLAGGLWEPIARSWLVWHKTVEVVLTSQGHRLIPTGSGDVNSEQDSA